MKKTIIIFVSTLVVSLIMISCSEPSFCDCNDRWGDLSESDQKKCAKMIDRLSKEELYRKMQDCENK